MPHSIIPFVSASRLNVVPKKNMDIHPIAIGESVHRLAAKALCTEMKQPFANVFSLLKHSVATPSGSELILHHIALLLDQNPIWTIAKKGISDALNSIERNHLLNETKQVFSRNSATRKTDGL